MEMRAENESFFIMSEFQEFICLKIFRELIFSYECQKPIYSRPRSAEISILDLHVLFI